MDGSPSHPIPLAGTEWTLPFVVECSGIVGATAVLLLPLRERPDFELEGVLLGLMSTDEVL